MGTEQDTFDRLRRIDFELADKVWDDLMDNGSEVLVWSEENECLGADFPVFKEEFERMTGWTVDDFLNEWSLTGGPLR